jgi:hypothetical protein
MDVPLSETGRSAHCVGGGSFNSKTTLIGFQGFFYRKQFEIFPAEVMKAYMGSKGIPIIRNFSAQ